MVGRAAPLRTCVGCRTRAATFDLLRVAAVGKACVPDPRSRLPGRGAHLHPDPACLDLAERRRAFPRALRLPGPLDTTPVREHIESRRAQAGQPAQHTVESEAGRDADEPSMSAQR